jgi:hypothetical protein
MADPAREQELRRRFDEAVALPADARARYLDGVADELLRERLAALLAQDAGATATALRAPYVGVEGAARRLGDFELLRPIGRGGMGVVFLARQLAPIERLVAVKLCADLAEGATVLARFRAEQAALARMQHPGIARAIAGGEGPDGAPYFVMEYVRGEPITAYCDRRRLPLAERARLLARVCDAVQHAHQKGVIHRDLKPGNLLVAEEAGTAQPKVIDFGVARAVAGQLVDASMTQPGAVVGTLQYMSPEQADPAQEIDTRADVWSLGVVAYELFAGRTPLELRGDAGSLLRFREDLASGAIPTLAQAAAAADAETARQRAEARATAPSAWLRDLGGDLGVVVGKALAVDRNRRYESASELGADLRRWLDGEPVAARPPSLGYALRCFVRRRRAAFAAAAATAFALVAGGVAAFVGLLDARAARDDEARVRRQLEAIVERQAAAEDFFEFAQLHGEPGLAAESPSLREALRAAEPMIAARWREQPRREAAARASLGRSLLWLGEPAAARAQLAQAWRLAEPESAAFPASALRVLGDLRQAESLAGDGDANARRVPTMLALARAAVAADAPQLADALARVAAFGWPDAARGEAYVAACDAALAAATALPDGARARMLAGEVLFALATAAAQAAILGADALLQRLEALARAAFGDDVQGAFVLGQLAENRLRMRQHGEALALADALLADLARLGLVQHWLHAQASRLRGLALAASDAAAAERELLSLRARLLPHAHTGNAQVRAAFAALAEWPSAAGDVATALDASLGRWLAGDRSGPWWPADLDEAKPGEVVAVALAACDRRGGDVPDDVRGALLLRLGRDAAALPLLERAAAAGSTTLELGADLVVALARTGQRARAVAAREALRSGRAIAFAGSATEARWQRALVRADAALQ